MTKRKATKTNEAINRTVRLASASTAGLGPRLGLNLRGRFCGPLCDDLFPATMAAGFVRDDGPQLIYAVSSCALSLSRQQTRWCECPIKQDVNGKQRLFATRRGPRAGAARDDLPADHRNGLDEVVASVLGSDPQRGLQLFDRRRFHDDRHAIDCNGLRRSAACLRLPVGL